ncbi:hypothetical protein GCM10023083_43640 [Streptomyces phyllanthi]
MDGPGRDVLMGLPPPVPVSVHEPVPSGAARCGMSRAKRVQVPRHSRPHKRNWQFLSLLGRESMCAATTFKRS